MDPQVDSAVKICFCDGLRSYTHLIPVLRMALASVVYHHAWVKDNVAPVFIQNTRLFATKGLLSSLYPMVECQVGRSSDSAIVATGIPVHINQLGRLALVEERLRTVEETLVARTQWVVSTTLEGVDKLFDEKSFQQGNITAATLRAEVQTTLTSALEQHGVLAALGRLEAAQQRGGAEPNTPDAGRQQPEGGPVMRGGVMVHNWGGGGVSPGARVLAASCREHIQWLVPVVAWE